MMEDWFLKLPPLPKNAREWLVKATPWIALIFGILGVLTGLAAIGVLTAFTPLIAMGGGFANAGGSLFSLVISLAASVLLLLAFPGTKAKKIGGWNFLFWSEVASVLAGLAALSIGSLIVSVIAFYLLFQIKAYYK